MEIIPSAFTSSQKFLQEAISDDIEDPVSYEPMIKAVSLVPCGHSINEDTAIKLLAQSKLCPIDRQPFESYIPNYNVRKLVEKALSPPAQKDESPNSEAEAHFLAGKNLFDAGEFEPAKEAFQQGLQVFPSYEKAHIYLEFCIKSISLKDSLKHDRPLVSASSLESEKENVANECYTKSNFIKTLIKLLQRPEVQKSSKLALHLRTLLTELTNQEIEELTVKQRENYQRAQKLLEERKARDLAKQKLQRISPLHSHECNHSHQPSASLLMAHASSQPQIKEAFYNWPEKTSRAADCSSSSKHTGVRSQSPFNTNASSSSYALPDKIESKSDQVRKQEARAVKLFAKYFDLEKPLLTVEEINYFFHLMAFSNEQELVEKFFDQKHKYIDALIREDMQVDVIFK